MPGGETVGIPCHDFEVLLEGLPYLSIVHNTQGEAVARRSWIDLKVEATFCKS